MWFVPCRATHLHPVPAGGPRAAGGSERRYVSSRENQRQDRLPQHEPAHTQYLCLFMLVYLSPAAGRKSCPLCPEEKFKACYSHKLRRHLHNLHWKVYVEFEGRQTGPASVTSSLKPSTTASTTSTSTTSGSTSSITFYVILHIGSKGLMQTPFGAWSSIKIRYTLLSLEGNFLFIILGGHWSLILDSNAVKYSCFT